MYQARIWRKPRATHAAAQQMMIRGLIEREDTAAAHAFSEDGRGVLAGFLARRRGNRVTGKSPEIATLQ
jgi:hypothetical protein